MFSNQLTTIDDLSNNNLIKLDWAKFIREKYANRSKIVSIDTNIKYDNNITSKVSKTTTNDNVTKINPHQSTHVSYYLFSQSKPILNKYNPKLILTKSHHIHRSISTSDCVDWTNHQSKTPSIKTTVNNQFDAIDVLDEFAQGINRHSYSAMNNNHFHSASIFHSNLQLSNNKEKKNKKEKSTEKEKKDDADVETKKSKKSKEKTKIIEETTTDTGSVLSSTSSITPTPVNPNSPKSPSYSPVETIGFPSLSIPVPHPSGLSTHGFISPDSSRIHIPQQSNIAHLSQVQQQLQTDPQNPSLHKTTYPHNMSVQQQLQSLSQMAHDGDEILITLNVNTLTQKQQIYNNSNHIQQNQFSFQTNPYSPHVWNPAIPRNLEIVAKGYARVQPEHSQPPSSNPYLQQQSMMPTYNQQPQTWVHPPFVPRYPMACYSNSGPPELPIGPPIQPIFAPPTIMIPDGLNRPQNPIDFMSSRQNYGNDYHSRSHLNTGKCDYICQSSLYQPDFRGRPSPGVTINPYISHSPAPINFSAKRSSKHSSRKNKSYNMNFEDINRTYSSVY